MSEKVIAVLDRIEQGQRVVDPLALPENATSLHLLQAVYRNPSLPLPTRMRAAMAAIQFEHPKLAVSALIPEHDGWVKRLEMAVEQSHKILSARKLEDGTFVADENGDG